MGESVIKISLGSGGKEPGYLCVDKHSAADLTLDLEEARLPFADDSISEIKAWHVFEHIRNILPLIKECWRVLQFGGVLDIRFPHIDHSNCWLDISHVNHWHKDSMVFMLVSSWAVGDVIGRWQTVTHIVTADESQDRFIKT